MGLMTWDYLSGEELYIAKLIQSKANAQTINTEADLAKWAPLENGSDGMGYYLVNDTDYDWGGVLTIDYPIFITGNHGFLGFGQINYNGTGALYRTVAGLSSGSFILNEIRSVDITGSATLFDINAPIIFRNQFSTAIGFDLGTISPYISFFLAASFVNFTGGLTVTGVDWGGGFVTRHEVVSTLWQYTTPIGGAITSYDGTFAKLSNTSAEIRALTGDSSIDIDSGITIQFLDYLNGNYADDLGGTAFASGSLDQTDPRFRFFAARGIPDSTVSAQVDIGDNSEVTLIPDSDAWVLVYSTTWVATDEERTSVDSYGVTQYTGLEPDRLLVPFSFTEEPATGVKQMSTRILKIGSESITVTFTNGTNTINETATELSNGDVISFYNNSGTLPSELREDVAYYVVNKATDSFQVSYTSGGAVVAFTDDGSGTNTYDLGTLNGIAAGAEVATGSPKSNSRFGLVSVQPNDKIGIVATTADGTNTEQLKGGYTISRTG